MEQITYDNIIDKLLEKFPEYKNSEQYYDELNKDLHYIVLGNLCLMAFEDIDNSRDHSMAEKLVRLADNIFNNPNSSDRLVNLFSVEVLENLVGSRTGAKLAKSLLSGKSLGFLNLTLKGYGTKEFRAEYFKALD